MVSICNKNVVSNAVNAVSDDLLKEYKTYFYTSANTSNSDVLYKNTALFNTFIHAPYITNMITATTYPSIFERLETNGFITPYEISVFIKDSLTINNDTFISDVYEPSSISDYDNEVANGGAAPTDLLVLNGTDVRYNQILYEFEYYLGTQYTTKESMSSFCEMVPDIFEKIERYTNLFNNFKSLINLVSGKIANIQNILATNSLSQLIDIVSSYTKSIFEKEMKRLENLSVGSMVNNQVLGPRIASKFMRLVDDAKKFFTKETLEEIIGIVKAQINYVIDFFKDPDIEEIQFIISRFCTLLSTFKNIFSSKISPIKKLAQSFNETNLALAVAGNMASSNAIRAGAIRFDPQVYSESSSGFSGVIHERSQQEGGNYNPTVINITAMDIDGVTPWNGGKGDSRIGFSGNWVSALGADAWYQTKSEVKIMLMQVQKAFGKRLIVYSCYRPPAYNATRKGAAKHSLHMKGLALDIHWDGFTTSTSEEAYRFINICKAVGFRGFGGYNSSKFIHIDIGNARNWGDLDGKT